MPKVCSGCLRNAGIRAFIAEQEDRGRCRFCRKYGARGTVADLDEVVTFIWDRIGQDYDDAANVLAYDSAEGGYQGAVYDSEDILTEHVQLDIDPAHEEAILEAVVGDRGDFAWCDRYAYSPSAYEFLEASWEGFCATVKTRARYFFNSRERGQSRYDMLLPRKLLERTAELVKEHSLIKVLEAGSTLHRVRHCEEGDAFTSALELGPPPPDKAVRANRMNPPGIPMFYGAESEAVALAETIVGKSDYTSARFRTERSVRVLDLGGELPAPDFFEVDSNKLQGANFLRKFASALAAPIARDDRNHVEYVPMQVVAEYFRNVFRWRGARIHGIRWRSRLGDSGCSYALFATRADLVLSAGEASELTVDGEPLPRHNARGRLTCGYTRRP